MKFRECIIFSSTCFHAYLEICHSSHLSLLFFDISLLHNERENFFSNNRSRVHFVVSNFILFSNFLRIYVYRHFATNAKNFPSDRLHFVVSYSFNFFLHFLFPPFLIFHSCVRVYVYTVRAEWPIKKTILIVRSYIVLASTMKICRTRRIEKESAWTNFSRIIALRIKKYRVSNHSTPMSKINFDNAREKCAEYFSVNLFYKRVIIFLLR